MLPDAFKEAVNIINTIESNDYEAYFVGGCVRDVLLKKKIKDIDIATSAPPTIIQSIFDKVIPVGLAHGTVIVRHQGVSYEVTTFREEATYSDQRHPDEVTYILNLKEDLKRRDFTMNALAMNKDGELIDITGGKLDIEKQMIRSVGNAADRFYEDPLRIVRALRFVSELGFSIETETFAQMKRLNKEVKMVAVERLLNEFTKLFQGQFVEKALTYLKQVEIDSYIPVFCHNPHLLKKVKLPFTPFYSFGEVIVYFHHIDSRISISTWIKEWKCSNEIKNEAINLYEALLYYQEKGIDKWLVYRLKQKHFQSFIHLVHQIHQNVTLHKHELNRLKKMLPIQSKNDLAVNGHDVMEMFPNKKRGPWISNLLENIEKAVVLQNIDNNKKAIKEWIQCHPPEVN